MEDAAAVAAMSSVHAPEPYAATWVEREWTEPGFDLERDARITDRAYVAAWNGHGGKAYIDLQGKPSAEMLARAEERAREKGLVRALGGGWSGDVAVRALLEGADYRLVRHHYRMRADLDSAREAPVWPAAIAVRTFRTGDERVFYELHQETFEDHWEFERQPYKEWEHWMLQPPIHEPDLWFLAEADGEPAGIAICHSRPEVEGLGWIGELGVRRPWRRQGLGRALMLHAFGEFRRRGFRTAGLGVDAESLTGAHRLYEKVGMHVAARADTYEKSLT